MNNLRLSINECSLIDQQSYHVSHLTVTLGIQFQAGFILNRKVLIQGLCGIMADVAKCGGERWTAHTMSMGTLQGDDTSDIGIK